MTEPLPIEAPELPRSVVIEQRLQVLEMEAAVQRTTLAATLEQWQQRRTLTWVIDAAKMAGNVLAGPTARYLITALVMGRLRSRYLSRSSSGIRSTAAGRVASGASPASDSSAARPL